jgi:hypothetical protein
LFAAESEQSDQRVERSPDDELLAARRESLRRSPTRLAGENRRSHGERRHHVGKYSSRECRKPSGGKRLLEG